MTKNKKAKREQLKQLKEEQRQKELEYKAHLIKMKELSHQDETGRMPLHIFSTHDDFVDDRLPLIPAKQLELARSVQDLPKLKSLY